MSGELHDLARTAAYAKDPSLELGLADLNAWLGEHRVPPSATCRAPITFVVGLQRSGSTLMMQLLAGGLDLAYPDNIVARLWRAPDIGFLISRSLRQQCRTISAFNSDYGVTDSPFEPHEFGYFWQHWLPLSSHHEPASDALSEVDVAGLTATLAAMEQAAGAPLLFKGVALALVLPYIASMLPTSRFIRVRRPLLDVALSTYRGRVERYGTSDAWWSLRPASFAAMRAASPVEQVAAQVSYCEQRIVAALDALPSSRVCTLDYSELAQRPQEALAHVAAFVGQVPRAIDIGAVARGRRTATDGHEVLRAELASALTRCTDAVHGY